MAYLKRAQLRPQHRSAMAVVDKVDDLELNLRAYRAVEALTLPEGIGAQEAADQLKTGQEVQHAGV